MIWAPKVFVHLRLAVKRLKPESWCDRELGALERFSRQRRLDLGLRTRPSPCRGAHDGEQGEEFQGVNSIMAGAARGLFAVQFWNEFRRDGHGRRIPGLSRRLHALDNAHEGGGIYRTHTVHIPWHDIIFVGFGEVFDLS
jgi:hypothetical protein